MGEYAPMVVWDLDGTLLDSMGVLEEGLGEVLPSYGIPAPTHEVVMANYHGSLEDSINATLGGVDGAMLKSIVADFLRVQDTYYDLIDHHLYPDAVDLARRFREAGHRQILVTNRAHEGRLRASPRHIVANSMLGSYIDIVVCGDDSQHRKPNPEVLHSVPGGVGFDPEQTVVVGDQFVDAQLAHNLGARAVLVARHGDIHHLDQLDDDWETKTRIVSSLYEVKVAS